MPVINGVYLKDFPALPSAVADANIIPIAITGNQIAYKTTVAGIVTDARVTSKLLTGLSVTGSTILATDTILQAFGKVQNQLNGKVSSVGLTMPAAFNVANSPITSAGTLAVTAAGLASQYIRGDGALADFPTTGGGGSSVSYYLNGSVSQGTIGGNAYYEMNKTPVIGTGTDFTIAADGYIAQFITDANDPSSLLIPGGNWNVEMYFSASSSGGTPSFYVEVYKYNGTTFTLLGSSATTPEGITNGTAIDIYYTSVGIPETVLTITDRLAIRVYVTHSGRTITLHTEDNHLSEIITTFSNGLTALNGLTKQAQYFAVGSTGTDFNISSSVDTHTFNIPSASATARGLITTGSQTIVGFKTFNSGIEASRTTGNTIASTCSATGGLAFYGQSSGGASAQFDSGAAGEPSLRVKHTNSGPLQHWLNASAVVATMSNAGALTIAGQLSLGSTITNGTYTYTLPGATGTLALTSDIHSAVTLSAIGSTANANGATLTGQVLNLQPADASFGGVVTTGTQTFAGAKTFSSDLTVNTLTVGRGGGAIVSNTAFGISALFPNTTGQLNTAIGYNSGALTNAGAVNQTSQTSVYIGADTRASASGNTNEIVIGCNGRGLGSNTTVLGNPLTVFGRFWGNLLVGDSSNSGEALQITGTSKFTGALSGTSATFSLDSTVNGVTVGRGAGNISSNTALGLEAFFSGNTTGTNNTAVGVGALRINTTSNSTAVGTNALTVSTTAGSNTGIGSYALQNITTGGNNTAIGVESGKGITTGTGNTILGITSVSLAAGLTNNIILSNGTGAIKAQHDGTNWAFTGAATFSSGIATLGYTASASYAALFNGSVGIGTTSPTELLEIKNANPIFSINQTTNSNDSGIRFKTNDTLIGRITAQGGNGNMNINMGVSPGWGGFITFQTDTIEATRITSGGVVLVNQTALSSAGAGTKMQVATDMLTTGSLAGYFWENRSGGVTANTNWYGWYTTSGTIYLYNGSANIASINTTTGVYTPLSDINKKKDFEQSEIGLNAILGLKPTLYRMKSDDDTEQKQLGFIAQEVKEFIPQAFVETKGEDENFVGLNYNAIVAALVKSVQELKAEIDLLKGEPIIPTDNNLE